MGKGLQEIQTFQKKRKNEKGTMELIDKNAVVAKMEELQDEAKIYPSDFGCGRLSICKELMNFLDTLEVKEVDLEKELSILDNTLFDLDGVAVVGATHYLTVEDVKDIAKHFFELGLKAQKGE